MGGLLLRARVVRAPAVLVIALAALLLASVLQVSSAAADENAPLPLSCSASALAAGDDATVQAALGFAVNVGDAATVNSVYISENGVLSFDEAIDAFFYAGNLSDVSAGDNEVIAPLFADAARDGGGSVTYGQTTYQGRSAFCVNWNDMEPFLGDSGVLPDPMPMNSFQVVLVERGDRDAGDFDIIVNYDTVEWDDSYCPSGDFGIEVNLRQTIQDGCCNDFDGEVPCFPGCDVELDQECCTPNDPFCEGVIGIGAFNRSVFNPFENAPAHAGVSFPSGDFSAGRIDFPGTGIIDAMIDPDGLSEQSLNSTQAGRYIIQVENGLQEDLGEVFGTVIDDGGSPIADSPVSICTDATSNVQCATTSTDELGEYEMAGLPLGSYIVEARGPAGTDFFANSVVHAVDTAELTVVAQIVLSGPIPIPDEIDFGPLSTWGTGTTVYWGEPLQLSITGCAGGAATWTLVADQGPSPLGGNLVENPAGTYTGEIPTLRPTHGNAEITTAIDCPPGVDDVEVMFTLYIDPSGVVRDINTGDLIDGATVVLLRRDSGAAFGTPLTQVADGDVGVMDPAVNTQNPSMTDISGEFGWDVTVGEYRATASKAGCASVPLPTAPTDWVNDVQTDALAIPTFPQASSTPILRVAPEWLDLTLYLDCSGPPPPPRPTTPILAATVPAAGESFPCPGEAGPRSLPIFAWRNSGAPVTDYWVQVGSTVGTNDVFDSGNIKQATAVIVQGLPNDGSTVYVRLWYRPAPNGAWTPMDTTYQTCGDGDGGPPGVGAISPADGAILSSSSVSMTWSDTADEYWVYVGTSQGARNYYDSGRIVGALGTTVTNLPRNGSTVFVRFWFRDANETWEFTDLTYTSN